MGNLYFMKINDIKNAKFRKFILRLQVCYKILFNKWPHWFIVPLTEPQLIQLIKGDLHEITFTMHGLQKYNVMQMVIEMSECYDADDMVLMKGDYEAAAQELGDKNREAKHN